MDLQELLARVALGQVEFRVENESDEARRRFGRTVDAACQAFMRGYVASLDTRWVLHSGQHCTEAVFVRELTERGLRLLEKAEVRVPGANLTLVR